MNRLVKLALFLLLPFAVLAQPGGGGGLQIKNCYRIRNNRVDSFEKNYVPQMRLFFLADTSMSGLVTEEVGGVTEQQPRRSYKESSLYFPPPGYFSDYNLYRDWHYLNYRLLWYYGGDTMVVDFLGVLPENAGGSISEMDSLVFQPGYYRYIKTTYLFVKNGYASYDASQQALDRGITPSTLARFRNERWLQYRGQADASFLNACEKNAYFLLQQGRYQLGIGDHGAAIRSLKKTLALQPGPDLRSEANLLLASAFRSKKDYDSALFFIDASIRAKKTADNCRMRHYINTAAGRYEDGLDDFQPMLSMEENPALLAYEREDYRMRYLKDYQTAEKQLQKLIGTPSCAHTDTCGHANRENAGYFFLLGNAEHALGKDTAAFEYWLKAFENNSYYISLQQQILFVDSLLLLHPKNPQLLLSAAILQQNNAAYLGGAEKTKEAYRASISYADSAAAAGLNDWRISYYKAMALSGLHEYQAALEEVTRSIGKNDRNPSSYMLRYHIRQDLGQAVWGNRNDPDVLKSEQLRKAQE